MKSCFVQKSLFSFLLGFGIFAQVIPALAADYQEPLCTNRNIDQVEYKASGQAADGTLILFPNTFWNTAANAHYYPAPVAAFISQYLNNNGYSSLLREWAGLSEDLRARQLQWVFRTINALRASQFANKIKLVVPVCRYDFTYIAGAAADTPESQALYNPKLYLAANQVEIVSKSPNTRPILSYRNANPNVRFQGRILLMLKSGLNGVQIHRVEFRGNHQVAQAANPDYYLHENTVALVGGGKTPYTQGLVIIGTTGAANDVSIDSCIFKDFNYTGLVIIGSATVTNSQFSGITPRPQGANPSVSYLANWMTFPLALKSKVQEVAGPNNFYSGMGFHTAIGVYNRYGKLEIKNNQFSDAMEGVSGESHSPGLLIQDNTFNWMADHSIYFFGNFHEYMIQRNIFSKGFNQAIKLGSNGARPDPLDFNVINLGPQHGTIQNNTFELIRHSGVLLSGSLNTITNNIFKPYVLAADPTGGWYNPSTVISTISNIHITTRGGNDFFTGACGYFQHAVFNKVTNNRSPLATDPPVIVYLEQFISGRANCTGRLDDRSVAFNSFAGTQQDVYVNMAADSKFAPVIIDLNNRVKAGRTPGCGRCTATELVTGYRTSLKMTEVLPIRFAGKSHFILRYENDPEYYLITAGGQHSRLSVPNELVEKIITADLNSDGNEEIYWKTIADSKIYGLNPNSIVLPNFPTLTKTTSQTSQASFMYYGGSMALKFWDVGVWHGNPQLFTIFTYGAPIYGSQLVSGIPRFSGPVYTPPAGSLPATQFISFLAADLGTWNESGDQRSSEFYVQVENKRLYQITPNPTATRQLSQFYAGTGVLAHYTKANLPGSGKEKLYLQFTNQSSRAIYETKVINGVLQQINDSSPRIYSGNYEATHLISTNLDQDGDDEIYLNFEAAAANKVYIYSQDSQSMAVVKNDSAAVQQIKPFHLNGDLAVDGLIGIFSDGLILSRNEPGSTLIRNGNILQDIVSQFQP